VFEGVQWDDEDEVEETAYLLHMRFDKEFLRKGSDPILLIRELAKLGELDMIPHLGSLPDLKNHDPEDIYLWWSAKLVTSRPAEEIENVLVFFQDDKNEVKFEQAESPPEDPGLSSHGIYDEREDKEQEQNKVDVSEVESNLEPEQKEGEKTKSESESNTIF
jgi:hypothetical protein